MIASGLSLVILAHNEVDELRVLLQWLEEHSACFDELIVVDDFSDTATDKLFEVFNCKVHKRRLDGDFASQRNFAIDRCSGEFVFFVDADEVPTHGLLSRLREITGKMLDEHCDICSVPRLNVVHDSAEFVDVTSMTFTDQALKEQVPDDQVRLIRRGRGVYYKYAVHEKASGGRKGLRLPPRIDYCLLHVKMRLRLERQNQIYSRLERFSLRAFARIAFKKLKLDFVVKGARSWFGPRWVPLR